MPHDHDHRYHGDGKLTLAVVVNLLLTVVQIVGGVLSGSLALIADAVHNLSDALSLMLAFAARRIARRDADATMTFGWNRAELIAALINLTALILIAIFLALEGVMRLFDPPGVDGWIVVWVAGVALIIATPLAVGAAKASIGHGEAASGQSGVQRLAATLGQLSSGGNAQLRRLNPLVGELWKATAAVLSTQPVQAGCGGGHYPELVVARAHSVRQSSPGPYLQPGARGQRQRLARGRRVVVRVQRHDRARAAAERAGW